MLRPLRPQALELAGDFGLKGDNVNMRQLTFVKDRQHCMLEAVIMTRMLFRKLITDCFLRILALNADVDAFGHLIFAVSISGHYHYYVLIFS